ncbi:MAG TPA: peptidase M64 N-terminal domain-containing protein, partial [Bryobacteraceae bacterium]|nr:peptidase M64 N-terminal domain-containing protein [Bryobacteraceae bacterium]
MFPLILLVSALLTAATAPAPRTMRVDYYHTGNATEERFSLDTVRIEGEWPGRLDRVIDDTNLGRYLFEVRDRKTNRILYSRGFAGI